MNKYKRKSIHSIEKIFSLIEDSIDFSILPVYIIRDLKKQKINIDGCDVKMYSGKYLTFKCKGIVCVSCKLQASFFALEQSIISDTDKFHLNLYGIRDNEEILFTKDHIIPKSKGGENNIRNYQTMCYTCNYAKGNKIITK